eukprot:PhM_4_TR14193/c0_g1_i1/m.27994
MCSRRFCWGVSIGTRMAKKRGINVEVLRRHMKHKGPRFQPGRSRMKFQHIFLYIFGPFYDRKLLSDAMQETIEANERVMARQRLMEEESVLSEQQVLEITRSFRRLNKSRTGLMTLEEFRALLPVPPLTPNAVEAIFTSMDVNGDGYVDLVEFVGAVRDMY